MQPAFEHIPDLLKGRDRWVVWKFEDRNGRKTKPPYVAATGRPRHALVNVSKTWGSFAQAKAAFATGAYDGVGFVLGDGIIGFDFDHATEEMVKEALSLGTYTEWSPSDLGVHVIGQSGFAVRGRKRGSVEFYAQGRYFTVTGNIVAGSPPDIRAIPEDVLRGFLARHFDDE
jgi:putative DNA primase/helicase